MANPKIVHALDEDIVSTFICLKNIEKNTPNSNPKEACKKVIYTKEITFALALNLGL